MTDWQSIQSSTLKKVKCLLSTQRDNKTKNKYNDLDCLPWGKTRGTSLLDTFYLLHRNMQQMTCVRWWYCFLAFWRIDEYLARDYVLSLYNSCIPRVIMLCERVMDASLAFVIELRHWSTKFNSTLTFTVYCPSCFLVEQINHCVIEFMYKSSDLN